MLRVLIAGLAALTVMTAAERTFEIRGRLTQRVWYARVELNRADRAYTASTLTVGGEFKFKKLPAGVYLVTVATRRGFQAQRTIEVGERSADRKGRVDVVLRLLRTKAGFAAANKVPYRVISLPKSAVKEYFRAHDLMERQNRDEGIAHLKRAVEIAPQFAEAWNDLGSIAFQSKQPAEAEKYFREALRVEPDMHAARLNLAALLMQTGRCEEALPLNLAAAGARPEDAYTNSQTGMNCACLGQDDRALEYLQRALRIDPSLYTYPQLAIASIYRRHGRTDLAIGEYVAFLRHHPASPKAAAVRSELDALQRQAGK